MIKAWINQFERDGRNTKELFDCTKHVAAGALAVAGPDQSAFCIPDRIAGPLEKQACRRLDDLIDDTASAKRFKESAVMYLFALALSAQKSREQHFAIEDDRRVCGEDHIGQTSDRLLNFNRCAEAFVGFLQLVPATPCVAGEPLRR